MKAEWYGKKLVLKESVTWSESNRIWRDIGRTAISTRADRGSVTFLAPLDSTHCIKNSHSLCLWTELEEGGLQGVLSGMTETLSMETQVQLTIFSSSYAALVRIYLLTFAIGKIWNTAIEKRNIWQTSTLVPVQMNSDIGPLNEWTLSLTHTM